VSIYKKRYYLIIQPKGGFFKLENRKRTEIVPQAYFRAFFLFTFAFWEKRGIL